ncbi:MAG: CRISPR-associated protein (Cas_NE0113) [Chloroflexi bacterium ADurb.Bin222]|nr:MAG: CRISPR-associated protein (Cas_NE0113) [Chloroflexi bacterium ADurb.Bin222]
MEPQVTSQLATTAVVTLGGQAQVVTLALDALLAAGATFDTVLILHLDPQQPRVARALAQLRAEFASTGAQPAYRGRPLRYETRVLHLHDSPLDAIHDGREAEAVWTQARDLLSELKRAGQRLHLCIAGGPRLLALTLASAAMLHCDHHDRLWHLYTPPEFLEAAREGALLHAPPEVDVRLVPVPLAPWGAYFPALRELAQATLPPTPPPSSDAARCTAVWARLTERERAALATLAEGALPQEAAEALGITLKTLDTYKTKILAECRAAWELPEDSWLTYHFIQEKFGTWLR